MNASIMHLLVHTTRLKAFHSILSSIIVFKFTATDLSMSGCISINNNAEVNINRYNRCQYEVTQVLFEIDDFNNFLSFIGRFIHSHPCCTVRVFLNLSSYDIQN